MGYVLNAISNKEDKFKGESELKMINLAEAIEQTLIDLKKEK